MAISNHELVPSDAPYDPSFLNDSEMVRQAWDLAELAYAGVVRKIRGEPFITHPLGVARIASEYDSSDFEQALCLLHDVIDVPEARARVSMVGVRRTFGADMLDGIHSLSKPAHHFGDHEARFLYLQSSKREKRAAIQIARLCDKLHNMEEAIVELDIVGNDFWQYFKGGRATYLRWPEDVMNAVEKSGAIPGHELFDRMEETLQRLHQAASKYSGNK